MVLTNSFFATQIIEQVRVLVQELCSAYNVPVPADSLEKLDQPLSALLGPAGSNSSNSFPTENSTDSGFSFINEDQQHNSDTEEDSDMEDEDLPIEMEEEPNATDKSKDDGLSHEHTATLERLRQSQRDSHLRGTVSGSVQG